MDEAVWNEFCNNWEEPFYQAQKNIGGEKQTSIEKIVKFLDIKDVPAGK